MKKLKPGGIVVVGLYTPYARNDMDPSKLISTFGLKIDYVIRNRIHTNAAQIWIEDQYFNPHETWHSIGEVQKWFENGIEYLNCTLPVLGTDGEIASSPFEPTESGTGYKRAITQLGWIATIARRRVVRCDRQKAFMTLDANTPRITLKGVVSPSSSASL